MANSNNEDDHGSYEGNSSLRTTSGLVVLPIDPIMGDINIPRPDPAPEANISTPAPVSAPNKAARPVVLNPLFCKQLHQSIMETINSTLHQSQAGPSSQMEREEGYHKSGYGRVGSYRAPTILNHPR
ncbi:UNVERIFIED_CONTAM: hypothetical protein Sradi_0888900 [Sesamum radiatum]|uniref:Uncharacterized protein n=1 Tax=Sesamum radiatum TaxID=300843 RepID=A0AAW2V580_SESRA